MATCRNIILVKHKKRNYAPVADALLKLANKENYDFGYLVQETKETKKYDNAIIFHNSLKDLNTFVGKIKSKRIGWWVGDYKPVETLVEQKISDKLTHIFLSSRALVQSYKEHFNIPSYWMPLCGADGFDRKRGRIVDWNVLFIGDVRKGVHEDRTKYLNPLKEFNLKIISKEGITKDMLFLYKNTPINISLSKNADGTTSNRLFNILCAGGFVLVQYFPGIEELFENGRDLVWFYDKDQLRAQVMYYLKNPYERKQIAKNGYNLYMKKHTAKHRIQNMFDIMEGKTQEFHGYN
jgi:hypothetical protein